MLISKTMVRSLSEQVANELGASHKYVAMACEFDSMGLKVFSRRFFAQADEERMHALKIARYLLDVGARVAFAAIPAPGSKFGTAREIVAAALESELTVTRQINDLMALAEKEKDYATRSFLQWFVTEQVEEVSSMTELLQLVDMAGDKNLFQVEARLLHLPAEGGAKEE